MTQVAYGNILEMLVALGAVSFSVLFFYLGKMLKAGYEAQFYRNVRENELFKKHERGAYFWVAWVGTWVCVAVLFPAYFASIYDAFDNIDTAPYILAFLGLYGLLGLAWLETQYGAGTRPTRWYLLPAILMLLTAVCEIAIVFVGLRGSDWSQYAGIVILFPPMFAIFASNSANTYRSEIYSSQPPGIVSLGSALPSLPSK